MGRRRRCEECWGCLWPENCRECLRCLDMVKYGGKGQLKQCCMYRQCVKMKCYKPPPEESDTPNETLEFDTASNEALESDTASNEVLPIKKQSSEKDLSASQFGYSSTHLESILNSANTSHLKVYLEKCQIEFYKEGGEVRVRLKNNGVDNAADRSTTPDSLLYSAATEGDDASDVTTDAETDVEEESCGDGLDMAKTVSIILERCDAPKSETNPKVNCRFLYKPHIKTSSQLILNAASATVSCSTVTVSPNQKSFKRKTKRNSSRRRRRDQRAMCYQPRQRSGGKSPFTGLPDVCAICARDNCKQCVNCLDMRQYGGPGVIRQRCMERICAKICSQPL